MGVVRPPCDKFSLGDTGAALAHCRVAPGLGISAKIPQGGWKTPSPGACAGPQRQQRLAEAAGSVEPLRHRGGDTSPAPLPSPGVVSGRSRSLPRCCHHHWATSQLRGAGQTPLLRGLRNWQGGPGTLGDTGVGWGEGSTPRGYSRVPELRHRPVGAAGKAQRCLSPPVPPSRRCYSGSDTGSASRASPAHADTGRRRSHRCH